LSCSKSKVSLLIHILSFMIRFMLLEWNEVLNIYMPYDWEND